MYLPAEHLAHKMLMEAVDKTPSVPIGERLVSRTESTHFGSIFYDVTSISSLSFFSLPLFQTHSPLPPSPPSPPSNLRRFGDD